MLLTVFTPTYNRCEKLKRVYESLKMQTVQDFVWLIVDDGSADNTRSLIEEISKDGLHGFEIRYHYQENGGKMRAHNTGSRLCDTRLFLCLDSDDILVPEAVETVIKCWERHEREHFCVKESAKRAGIVAYKGESASGLDDILAQKSFAAAVRLFRDAAFPMSIVNRGYSTLRGLYLEGFVGETTLVFDTEYLRKYPFPEIEGEKYVPEDYIYDKIDSECPLLVVDSVLTVCEILEGGYTDQAAKLRRDNPRGWFLYYEQRARIQDWSVLKIKYLAHYLRFAHILGEKPSIGGLEYIAGAVGELALKIFGKT